MLLCFTSSQIFTFLVKHCTALPPQPSKNDLNDTIRDTITFWLNCSQLIDIQHMISGHEYKISLGATGLVDQQKTIQFLKMWGFAAYLFIGKWSFLDCLGFGLLVGYNMKTLTFNRLNNSSQNIIDTKNHNKLQPQYVLYIYSIVHSCVY